MGGLSNRVRYNILMIIRKLPSSYMELTGVRLPHGRPELADDSFSGANSMNERSK